MPEPMYSPPATPVHETDGPYYNDPLPARPIAGNTADDDGEAIDGFFEAQEVGPQIYGIPDTKIDKLPRTNRILSKTLPMQVGVPLLYFPADPRRKSLKFTISGTTTVIRFASTSSGCNGSARLLGTNAATVQGVNDWSDYTGPVWLMNDGAADLASDLVNVWVVTE